MPPTLINRTELDERDGRNNRLFMVLNEDVELIEVFEYVPKGTYVAYIPHRTIAGRGRLVRLDDHFEFKDYAEAAKVVEEQMLEDRLSETAESGLSMSEQTRYDRLLKRRKRRGIMRGWNGVTVREVKDHGHLIAIPETP